MTKAKPNEFYMLPKWLWDITRENRTATMRDAADLFMLMMHRLKLSTKNGFVDKDNHFFIYFTYAEVSNMFNCGKTKVWQMYKLLKEKGLVTVKYQGFGYPMMVYVHAAAVINTDTAETEKEIKVQAASELHTQLCNGTFTESQMAEIMNIVDELAPSGTNNDEKCNFVEHMYQKLVAAEKKKEIANRIGYFIAMLKNSVFQRVKPPPKKATPSFDLDVIMNHAISHKPTVD